MYYDIRFKIFYKIFIYTFPLKYSYFLQNNQQYYIDDYIDFLRVFINCFNIFVCGE